MTLNNIEEIAIFIVEDGDPANQESLKSSKISANFDQVDYSEAVSYTHLTLPTKA